MHFSCFVFLNLYYPHPVFYSSSCFQSGLNISKMIIYKRRQEAKQKRRERRAERRAKRQAKREVMFSILFSFQLLSLGVTAASLLAHCIFLSYANHIHVISHYIQKPPFWAFFSCLAAPPQQPFPSLTSICPLHNMSHTDAKECRQDGDECQR